MPRRSSKSKKNVVGKAGSCWNLIPKRGIGKAAANWQVQIILQGKPDGTRRREGQKMLRLTYKLDRGGRRNELLNGNGPSQRTHEWTKGGHVAEGEGVSKQI